MEALTHEAGINAKNVLERKNPRHIPQEANTGRDLWSNNSRTSKNFLKT